MLVMSWQLLYLDGQQGSLGLCLDSLAALLHICNEASEEVAASDLSLQAVDAANRQQHGRSKGRL